MSRSAVFLCVTLLAGCSPPAAEPGEPEHFSEGFAELQHTKLKKVDILIVLDNSSSMADQQALLAANLGSFIEVLEAEDVDADYRIAITTTDAGHPACTSSTPERGAFMLTPCTSRLDEFVADGEGGPSDVRALACSDSCGLESADLEILPTTTDEDPIPRARPWLERGHGRSNLREGVDMADALRCFAPQGVAGCDFEMPLESMRQGLLRARSNRPADVGHDTPSLFPVLCTRHQYRNDPVRARLHRRGAPPRFGRFRAHPRVCPRRARIRHQCRDARLSDAI